MRKIWSYLTIPAAALAVLTGSIAWVLLLRPFYYVQIGPLGVCDASGLTAAQVRAAYGDVMDYCLGLRPDFAAGVLPFSAEGASHFADVRGLFILDLAVLAAALLFLLGLWIVCRRRRTALPRLGGRAPGFWAACGLGGVILIVAALAATDFDRAFTIFHSIFFPGKENWLFDPATDPVILLLPEEFFRNCAIAIAVSLLGLCLVPCLYAWFNILSNWDPYGVASTSRIKVAVASEDQGYQVMGLELNIGELVLQGLESND